MHNILRHYRKMDSRLKFFIMFGLACLPLNYYREYTVLSNVAIFIIVIAVSIFLIDFIAHIYNCMKAIYINLNSRRYLINPSFFNRAYRGIEINYKKGDKVFYIRIIPSLYSLGNIDERSEFFSGEIPVSSIEIFSEDYKVIGQSLITTGSSYNPASRTRTVNQTINTGMMNSGADLMTLKIAGKIMIYQVFRKASVKKIREVLDIIKLESQL